MSQLPYTPPRIRPPNAKGSIIVMSVTLTVEKEATPPLLLAAAASSTLTKEGCHRSATTTGPPPRRPAGAFHGGRRSGPADRSGLSTRGEQRRREKEMRTPFQLIDVILCMVFWFSSILIKKKCCLHHFDAEDGGFNLHFGEKN